MRKAAKAMTCGADAIILDLEDAVAPAAKTDARMITDAFLRDHVGVAERPRLWVRVNPIESPHYCDDLAVAIRAGADGIVLPKAEGAGDVARLAHDMDALDPASTAGILAIATETPRAVLRLASFAEQRVARLTGLTWGAEDLATALAATGNRHADGRFFDAFLTARSLALIAAHAAGVQAVDTLHADFRDEAGLIASCEAARREGFSGRLAIHPAQVGPINAAFSPTEEEVVQARRIIAAFAEAGAVGTVGLDGKMLDRPHLAQAEAIVARYESLPT